MLKAKIEQFRDAPEGLERLFRDAKNAGDLHDFKRALAEIFADSPDDLLLAAWAYRLDLQPVASDGKDTAIDQWASRRWPVAIVISLCLGFIYAYFADATMYNTYPASPNPRLDAAWSWFGWAPAAAWATLAYLALVDGRPERRRFYLYTGLGVAGLALVAASLFWGAEGDIHNLVVLHLPFLVWAMVGAGLSLGVRQPARQFFSYIVKSIEVLLTAFIYLFAGMIFTGLTLGIFSVLGVNLPERWQILIPGWGVGVIPVIAVASVYVANRPPVRQDLGAGPASILRVVARLILPLAIGVLVVYAGFVATNFWRPFREREVLLVYNATVLALIALLTYVVPGPDEETGRTQSKWLHSGLLAASVLTFLLNSYSLAALVSRAVNSGLTPNRHAGLGWNVATLLMLGILIWSLLRSDPDSWPESFSRWFGRAIALTFAWSLWVIFVLPFV